jgi:hypothetical protein
MLLSGNDDDDKQQQQQQQQQQQHRLYNTPVLAAQKIDVLDGSSKSERFLQISCIVCIILWHLMLL